MDFKKVEAKWQKYWQEHPELYRANDEKIAASPSETDPRNDKEKPKKYVLVEFPYPSGSGLHVGHAFSFIGSDIYARTKRMQGNEVLFPMGWDAFGLPTENYAIKMKRKPQEVTKENTDMFRRQMKQLALSFDWEREIDTTDPNYYKWTQWIFIQLFKKGLAYKKEMPINWCPACKIGLANEEVIQKKSKIQNPKSNKIEEISINVCERCETEVERRTISQWIVKITDYADRLIDGLKDTTFIEKVKQVQINWIGKSEGARIKFKLSADSESILSCSRPSSDIKSSSDDSARKIDTSSAYELEVFTTRPDTIFGATFMVVAPEHNIVSDLILQCSRLSSDIKSSSDDSALKIKPETIEEIKKYVKQARSKSDLERTELSKDKTGVFLGLYAINPMTGKEIPIWISDFVLASYGTGAIMSVPAHDERDWAFAKKFGLPIIEVIENVGADLMSDQLEGRPSTKADRQELPVRGKLINSGEWNGIMVPEEKERIYEWIEKNGIGEVTSNYHLRDWIFSRQHYWGEPIPMIFCKYCAEKKIAASSETPSSKGGLTRNDVNVGWVPVPEDQLPVVLPEVEKYEPTDDGQSPLAKMTEWVNIKCPQCGGDATRETDTMPNWAGSDWYFLAYCLANKINGKIATSPPKADPRNDVGLNDIFSDSREVLKKWLPVDVYVGGDEHNTLHLLYSRFIYLFLWDLGVVPKEYPEPYKKRLSHGVILGMDGNKMSKSKGNIIVPEVVAEKYGVDVVRMYLMFIGPFDGTMAWNENTLMGVKRFLEKLEKQIEFQLTNNQGNNNIASSNEVLLLINKLTKGVTEDIELFKFNTAIAKMMEALNKISNFKFQISNEEIKTIVKLLAPMAPYLTEELWHKLGEKGSVHNASWPEYEEKYLTEEILKIAVAVNGKVRSVIEIDSNLKNDEQKVLEIAKTNEKVKPWIDGKKIMKEIYIPGKMVNLVIK